MKNNLIKISFKCLSFILVIVPMSVSALHGDEQKPIKIEANFGTADLSKHQVAIFEGNVVITRGSLIVRADKAEAQQDTQGYKSIVLYGKPVTFEQIDNDGKKIEGQGNQFNYNTRSYLAVLTGRARVKKGQNIIIGNIISYNTQTQIYSAAATPANGVSKKSSGRVTVILEPMNK